MKNREFLEVKEDGYLGMDTFTIDTVRYGIGISEEVQYFNGTVNGTLLHYYFVILL